MFHENINQKKIKKECYEQLDHCHDKYGMCVPFHTEHCEECHRDCQCFDNI